jgi:hypothetical protein
MIMKAGAYQILICILSLILILLFGGCATIEESIDILRDACGEQVVLTLEEGPDDFRVCSTSRCTLRDAIATANACEGRQIVRLPVGAEFVMTSVDNPPSGSAKVETEEEFSRVGASALPPIKGDIVIEGNAASIRRHGDVRYSLRLFNVLSGSKLELRNLTISGWHGGKTRRIGSSDFGIGGGAVLNEGEIFLEGVSLQDNSSTGGGGALHNLGTATIISSNLQNNSGNPGGAIFTAGILQLERSVLQNNSVRLLHRVGRLLDHSGGAIFINSGETNAMEVTIRNNEAMEAAGGGIAVYNGRLSIERSTIVNNTAVDGAGIIVQYAGTASVDNTTISGNRIIGISGVGGGIYNDNGTLHIHDSSIVKNIASTGIGYDSTPRGGGISNNGFTLVSNTIVAENMGNDCVAIPTLGDFVAIGQNLDTDETCPGFSIDGESGTIFYPLSDNGGTTLTHGLKTTGPAIDAGSSCLSVDQRGEHRPAGRACEIGAFELQP